MIALPAINVYARYIVRDATVQYPTWNTAVHVGVTDS